MYSKLTTIFLALFASVAMGASFPATEIRQGGFPLSSTNSLAVRLTDGTSFYSGFPVTQQGTWTTGRTWSLLNTTDSVNSVQSGAWTTGRTWTLLNTTDSVNAVQSGTWTTGRTWTLGSGTDSIASVQSGTWNLNNITGTISLPTGAATLAAQTTGNNSLSSIDGKTPTLGQKNMAGSTPVVLASDQSSIPVSIGSSALPTGAATEATLSAINGKITAVNTGAVVVSSSALPTGAATAANQTTGNSSLSSIDTKTPALVSGRVPTDGSGVTQPISAASLPLPTGAATAAAQATGNGSLASIDTKTPALVSGRIPTDGSGVTQPISAAALPLPAGAATAANQATTNGSLAQIDADLDVALSTRASESTLSAVNTKLSDGSQKAIARGGAKGSTTAADVTSTNVDANTQALDVAVKQSALPTGAATEATLSALNAKVTAVNTGAVTVAASALPSGAATEATLATRATESTASAINSKLNSLGQKNSAGSVPVVVASDQSSLTVVQPTGTNLHTVVDSSALPTGAATSAAQATMIANQTNGTQSARLLDGATGGNIATYDLDNTGGTSYNLGVTMRGLANGTPIDLAMSTTPPSTMTGLVVRPIPNEPATFSATAEDIATANNKSMISIQNTGTGVIKIREIWLVNSRTAAAAGVSANFRIHRIASFTGGTAITAVTHDTADTLPAGISAATGATIATETSLYRSVDWSTDEWIPDSTDVEAFDHQVQTANPVWEAKDGAKPIVIRQNQGAHVRCATNTTTGIFTLRIVFTVE